MCGNSRANADLAHLVERDLAKVEVAGSSPVIRLWRHSQAVRQRSAKPLSPVRFRVAPSKQKALRKKCFLFWNDVCPCGQVMLPSAVMFAA